MSMWKRKPYIREGIYTNEEDILNHLKTILLIYEDDLALLPPQYHASVHSAIQYKYLMEEMERMLGALVTSVVPQLCEPLQKFTCSLFEFNEAYMGNLRGYYQFYCVRGKLMISLLKAQRDVQSTEALLDVIMEIVSNGKNLVYYSNNLKEAIKQLQRTIITITADGNSKHQLEDDLEKSYERASNLKLEEQNIWVELESEQKILCSLESERKNTDSTDAKILNLSNKVHILEVRQANELRVTKGLEEMLTSPSLLDIGCNDNTRRILSETFNITLTLFVGLADVVSQLSTTFSTSRAMIKSTSEVSWEVAIGILNTVTKLAIGGEYMAKNSFTIGREPMFEHLRNALTQNKKNPDQLALCSPMKPEDIF